MGGAQELADAHLGHAQADSDLPLREPLGVVEAKDLPVARGQSAGCALDRLYLAAAGHHVVRPRSGVGEPLLAVDDLLQRKWALPSLDA